MIISNRLHRLLIVSIFFFPVLWLGGCSADKARLGSCSGQEAIATSQPQAQQADSGSKKFIDWAGCFGKKTGYLFGGILGGMAGACVDGALVYFSNTDPGTVKMSTTYKSASGGSWLFGTGCNYACTAVATGLVWLTPYVVKSTKWLANNSYTGIIYTGSSIYDYYTQADDISNDNSNNREPNIFTYEDHIGDDPEPFTVLEYKDHDSDHDSDYGSGDESGDDVYFDANE
ncbi:hypothetical protein ACRRVD_01740 [Candidatus Cardinium hertigii]|uniref:hypothetical protein n=1 Tax=Candidatus Cardinium hertigii TaxID=247481 RepID=UPI003D7EED29